MHKYITAAMSIASLTFYCKFTILLSSQVIIKNRMSFFVNLNKVQLKVTIFQRARRNYFLEIYFQKLCLLLSIQYNQALSILSLLFIYSLFICYYHAYVPIHNSFKYCKANKEKHASPGETPFRQPSALSCSTTTAYPPGVVLSPHLSISCCL